MLSIFRYGQDEVLAPYVEKYLAAADTLIDTLGFHKALGRAGVRLPEGGWLARAGRPRRRLAGRATPRPRAPQRYVAEGRDDVARALAAQAKDADSAESAPSAHAGAGSGQIRPVSVSSACRVSGARACSASIWMPRRSPPTRSPAANDGLHLQGRQLDLAVGEVAAHGAAGDDLEDARGRVDHDQDAARRGDQRVVQLGGEGLAGPPRRRRRRR